VAFVATHYFNVQHTLAYIENVGGLNGGLPAQKRLVVVSNGGTEEEHDLLRRALETCSFHAELIVNPSNLGYFRGLNVGLEQIVDQHPVFCVVGNNDLLFAENFLRELWNLEVTRDVFVVCPRIRNADGEDQNPYYPTQPTMLQRALLWVYFRNYMAATVVRRAARMLRPRRRRVRDTGRGIANTFIWAGHGSCYVLTEAWFRHARLLPSSLFLTGEEVMLAHLIRLFGGRQLFAPALEVWHEEHAATAAMPSSRYYDIARSAYATYRDYY
jgi:GT2 family glycosyltransferase